MKEHRLVRCEECLLWFIRVGRHSCFSRNASHKYANLNPSTATESGALHCSDCLQSSSNVLSQSNISLDSNFSPLSTMHLDCWDFINSLSVEFAPARSVRHIPQCLTASF